MGQTGLEIMTGTVRKGALTIDFPSNKLTYNKMQSKIEPRVMSVLGFLIQNEGKVVERQAFFDAVWDGIALTDDSLNRTISILRREFKALGLEDIIHTVPKRGYRLDFPASLITEASETDQALVPAATKKSLSMATYVVIAIVAVAGAVSGAVWIGAGLSEQSVASPSISDNPSAPVPRDVDRRVIRSALSVLIENGRPIDRAVEALMETATLDGALTSLQNNFNELEDRLSIEETTALLHQIGALSFDRREEVALASYKEIIALDQDDWLASWQLARLHNLRQEKAEAARRIEYALTSNALSPGQRLRLQITEARISVPPFDIAAQRLNGLAEEALRTGDQRVWSVAIALAINYEWLTIATSDVTNYDPLGARLPLLQQAAGYQLNNGLDHEAAETLSLDGVIKRSLGEHEAALASFLNALEIEQVLSRPAHLHRLYSNIANTYYAQSGFDEADQYNERAIETARSAGLITDLPFNWQLSARIARASGQEEAVCARLERASIAYDPELNMQDRLREIQNDLGCTI